MLKAVSLQRLQKRSAISLIIRKFSNTMSEESSKLRIASFGNTGTVGNCFVQCALADARVEKIYLVNRRVLPIKENEDPRIEHVLITDFENGYAAAFDNIKSPVNMVHWALGSPPTLGYAVLGTGADEYHNAHVKYPTKAAEYFHSKNPDVVFHYTSGDGASEGSYINFLHQKGLGERSVSESCKSVIYRSRAVGPIDGIVTLPSFAFVPGDVYGKAILATHTKVCDGTVAPGKIMYHGDIHEAGK